MLSETAFAQYSFPLISTPMSASPSRDRVGTAPREFRTTRWSAVLRAAHGTSRDSAEALETLCRTYWYPLYAFVRRSGRTPEQAEDITQEFFSRLVSGKDLAQVSPDKGRFRSFLLGALKNLLANEWRDANRIKRGGGREIVAWDHLEAEERYNLEPAGDATPEAFFDRGWAQTVVAQVLARLEAEMTQDGLADRFALLGPFLNAESAGGYGEVPARLGLSEGAVKTAVHRMRRRYAELIREEISQTVASPDEVEAEIRHLVAAFAGEKAAA
jgi:RNA polymerase sigma factor (sigma-70 family)